MDDTFLDVSWSLHYHPNHSAQSYRRIFATSTAQNQLDAYSNRLSTYLTSQSALPKDDFDTEDEKLGAFQECKWSATPRPQPSSVGPRSTTQTKRCISISVVYQKQTFKLILYSAFLTLSKASPVHTKRIFDFISETFGISLDSLKLSPDFLQGTLANYITTITEHAADLDNESTVGNETTNLSRLSILKTAVSNVKLSIAFTGPVAPGLKTIDLDIPYDTVDTLISSATHLHQSSPGARSPTDAAESDPGTKFLANLAHYITEQTGLKLPLVPMRQDDTDPSSTNGSADGSAVTNASPARLSRITTAFWVFSAEGKIKFASRVVESSPGFEEVIRAAGADILSSLDREARRRVAG